MSGVKNLSESIHPNNIIIYQSTLKALTRSDRENQTILENHANGQNISRKSHTIQNLNRFCIYHAPVTTTRLF